jgi:transcriptional regulator with XRE-family HTH domain
MRDAIKMMESKMKAESVARSRMIAEQEILTIKLGKLREKLGVKQTEFSNYSQTSVSRIEKRKDIRISTLIEYLDNLGMGLEIKTFPKKRKKNTISEEILLKV